MALMNLDSMSERTSFLASDSRDWDWSDLRDFVVREIEVRRGAQPRDSKKEASIFKRFKNTWGEDAGPIAEYAFNVHEGWWAGAPISINRFCKGSDPYFAAKIAEALHS